MDGNDWTLKGPLGPRNQFREKKKQKKKSEAQGGANAMHAVSSHAASGLPLVSFHDHFVPNALSLWTRKWAHGDVPKREGAWRVDADERSGKLSNHVSNGYLHSFSLALSAAN